MKKRENHNLGIVFRPEHSPEKLPDFACRAEEAGFDELWVWEDCFYASGFSSAATALSVTDKIAVGVGILPAVARNPVFTAMEIATLARLFPGRFLPGLGHGVARWMRQIGAFPKSQLAALEETTITIRKMLAGECVTYEGKQVQLQDVELIHPPDQVPPISLGVRGPKSLALSGRVADGTIFAEYAGPTYISWAREQIESGKLEAGHDREHHMTVFALTCAGVTTADAHEQLRPLMASVIASGKRDGQLAPLGILPQVRELRESLNLEQFSTTMPVAWIEELAIAGTPDDWNTAVDRFVSAGANSIVLVPLPGKGLDEIEPFTRHLL